MALTGTQISNISPTGHRAIAFYRLGYGTLSSGTLEEFGASISGIIEELLRKLMFPFLEPGNRPGPRTVFCSDDETIYEDEELCESACSDAGVTWESYANNDERFAACTTSWLG